LPLLAALALFTLAFVPMCAPSATSASCPPAPAAAPCKATLVTDTLTKEGIDTRTGCLVVNMALGSVDGATDLSLAVSLVHNEGIVPPTSLYKDAWWGLGTWLSVDEYVTKDSDTQYTLHTPNGDVVYDKEARVPDATQSTVDAKDDSKTTLVTAYRPRPFDGTLLFVKDCSYRIVMGNPLDTRSLTKWYGDAFPGADAKSTTRLLTRLSKASIYKGPTNEIVIKRNYDCSNGGPTVTFTSSLFTDSGKTPLTVWGARPRDDGAKGFQVKALTTLLHGWQSTAVALAKENGNIEKVTSNGRNKDETQQTAFTYMNEDTATKTVFGSIVVQEGSAADLRTLSSLEFTKRDDGSDKSWPFAVQTMVDHSRPGADRTHVISECDHKSNATYALPKYFTFNYPEGTSAAYEYADDHYRGMLVRTLDVTGKETLLNYNLARGGGDPGSSTPATAFELHFFQVNTGGKVAQQILYRYDKFSADTYGPSAGNGLPMVAKVSVPKSVGDKQVLYRAVFGDVNDQTAGRVQRSFAVPRAVAGTDGRVRWEYRGLDGFTYEVWDEDGVLMTFAWTGSDKNGDGTYSTETIETAILGVPEKRVSRDRFGRITQAVDLDPALGADSQPTLTYHIPADGVTDRIDDSATGERFAIGSWNGPKSSIVSGTLTRNGTTVSSFSAPQDDFGNTDGAGSVKLGSVTMSTSVQRASAGLLKSLTVSGPGAQSVAGVLGYQDKDMVPNSYTMNTQTSRSVAPKAMTAEGSCK
jgi:hypothetical protein